MDFKSGDKNFSKKDQALDTQEKGRKKLKEETIVMI